LLRLEQWLSGVALSGHPLSEKAEQLFHCLERAAPALERRKTCACHGDFSPAQVILGEGRIATCDWDSYCVADRHYDVARFLTALEIMARKYFGSVRALDASADVFLRTYATFGKPISASNLQFYKAAHHLKLIRRKLVKPYWRQRIEATLDDSLRMLEPMTA
jgi:aminoglycoside phosphotransferase (APT) family kinase protein